MIIKTPLYKKLLYKRGYNMVKEPITALMGKGAEYQGQLNFKGAVRIDGRFLGTITSEGKLVLGKDAYVEGSITVGELEVHGTLSGDVSVLRRTLLHETAKVAGSLRTPRLAMEEGALLQGDLQMDKTLKPGMEAAETGITQSEHSVRFMDTPVKQ